MIHRSTDTDTDSAKARGAAYGLIAYGFQYPDRSAVDMLCDPARWSSWPEALSAVDPQAAACLGPLRELLESADRASTLQGVYNDIFGHAVRGKCPPYELEYASGEIIQLASGLADIAGFYKAFGMEVTSDAEERADHLTVECEFMSVLCGKETLAIEEANAEHVDLTVAAQRDFLRDHLATWLPAFTHRVQQVHPQSFHGGLARFAAAFVAGECQRFDIVVGPPTLKLRPADPVLDTSISCGSPGGEDELVQIDTANAGDQ